MKDLFRVIAGLSILAACSGTGDSSRRGGQPADLASEAVCPEGWLRYEPAEVELTGKLAVVSRFGPPNFGETPAADERISVPVLILSSPVSVCADTTSDANNEALSGVDSIQLVRDDALQRLVGRSMVVRGRLSRAVTGRQYFPAVLTVTSVRGL